MTKNADPLLIRDKALTVDGSLTIKNLEGHDGAEHFKETNEKLCSEDVEYSSLAFNSKTGRLGIFQAESFEQPQIEIFSMKNFHQ